MKKLLIPPFFILICILLTILCCITLPKYNLFLFPYNIVGVIILLAGFSIMGKTHSYFKKYKTTLFLKQSNYLITEGIFSKTRNPMYIGMSLVLLGISVCSGNLISLISPVLFIILVSILIIPKEEKMLEEVFGKEYQRYKLNVKRWI